MSRPSVRHSPFPALVSVAVLALTSASHASPESGGSAWFMAGSKPASYTMTIDRKTMHGGGGSGALACKVAKPDGFGTMMQKVKADAWLGKRMRLSAWVKSADVSGWSGVWMRVDGTRDQMLAFDNMQTRPIKGTTGWTRYDIVLDVPADARAVAFGILLDGAGKVWMDDLAFTEVDATVPVTGSGVGGSWTPAAPENLDFEK